MLITLDPKGIFLKLLGIIFLLLLLNGMGIVTQHYGYHIYGLVKLFNFDLETNIPTLYSVVALLFASLLLLMITREHKQAHQPYAAWLGLMLLFLFLAIDEFASIHEHFSYTLHDSLETSGLFFYVWVVPYGVAFILFSLLYLKFLMRLPSRSRLLFILSGGIFVAGAIGMEMVGGWYHELYGDQTLVYALLYSCEEFLEMFGIALFIYALLEYMLKQFGVLRVEVTKGSH